MKLLVAGGRDFDNKDVVYEILDEIHRVFEIDELCHGNAAGADKLAGRWAIERGVPWTGYPADWRKWGKAAGPIRNQQMLDDFKPDMALFFPGGTGTADMRTRCESDDHVIVIAECARRKDDADV